MNSKFNISDDRATAMAASRVCQRRRSASESDASLRDNEGINPAPNNALRYTNLAPIGEENAAGIVRRNKRREKCKSAFGLTDTARDLHIKKNGEVSAATLLALHKQLDNSLQKYLENMDTRRAAQTLFNEREIRELWRKLEAKDDHIQKLEKENQQLVNERTLQEEKIKQMEIQLKAEEFPNPTANPQQVSESDQETPPNELLTPQAQETARDSDDN